MDLSVDIPINVGDGRRCVAIIIFEDTLIEMDEYFQVNIEGTTRSSRVVILDDDGK